MNEKKTLRTTYRRFENYLYFMGFLPVRSYKSWDYSTVWEYEDTPELRKAAEGFPEYNERIKAMRGGSFHD